MDATKINDLLDSIGSFDRKWIDPSSSQTSEALEAISRLRRDVEKLDQTLANPEAKFWLTLRKSALLSPIKIAQDLGLFRTIQECGRIDSTELSEKTGAEESLIVRILRILTAEGLVEELDVQTYGPLPAGRPFAEKHNEDTVAWAMLFLPIALENPAYWASMNYRSTTSSSLALNAPTNKDDHEVDSSAAAVAAAATKPNGNGSGTETARYANPFEYHFKRPGYGLFDWTRENPEIQAIFASSMQAARAGQKRKQQQQQPPAEAEGGAYPYAKVMASLPPGQDVMIVDVAGGHGQALRDIAARVDRAAMRGRWILQDLPAALAEMKEEIEGVEVVPADIFEEQPTKGASIYHLRRVLHDWDDGRSVEILRRVVAAMDAERSRVLIVDAVLPNRNVGLMDALSDHSMMVFGGRERSRRQWEELVSAAGLRIASVWQGEEKEAVIECFKA